MSHVPFFATQASNACRCRATPASPQMQPPVQHRPLMQGHCSASTTYAASPAYVASSSVLPPQLMQPHLQQSLSVRSDRTASTTGAAAAAAAATPRRVEVWPQRVWVDVGVRQTIAAAVCMCMCDAVAAVADGLLGYQGYASLRVMLFVMVAWKCGGVKAALVE